MFWRCCLPAPAAATGLRVLCCAFTVVTRHTDQSEPALPAVAPLMLNDFSRKLRLPGSFVFVVCSACAQMATCKICCALLRNCEVCPARGSKFTQWKLQQIYSKFTANIHCGIYSCLCVACRYLFNAGEGFQRYCVEHRHRLVRMKQVLATQASHTALGGLPGADLLHFQRAGQGPSLHGCMGKLVAARQHWATLVLHWRSQWDAVVRTTASCPLLVFCCVPGWPPIHFCQKQRAGTQGCKSGALVHNYCSPPR